MLIPQICTCTQLHPTTDLQLIWSLDVQMSSLLFFIGSYKKLCEEGRPPYVRSETQTLFEVCGGRSSTGKDSSSTKTSVPAVVSQRRRGNAKSTPGCCNKCLRVVVKQDNSRVFSSLFLLQWRHICDVGTVRGAYEVSDLMELFPLKINSTVSLKHFISFVYFKVLKIFPV